MLVWVSRQASLHSSLQYCVGVLHLGVEKCVGKVSLPLTCQAASVTQLCRGVGQVSLPVTCQAASIMQPDKLTWSCDHASHVLRHHAGVTTFSQCTSSCRTGDSNSCPPDLEIGTLTKWLASVWVSRQASLQYYEYEFSDSVRGLERERNGFQTCEFLAAGREKPLGFPTHFKCWHLAQILKNKAQDTIFVIGVCDHILKIKYTSKAKYEDKERKL